jgi:hypothetical protein
MGKLADENMVKILQSLNATLDILCVDLEILRRAIAKSNHRVDEIQLKVEEMKKIVMD